MNYPQKISYILQQGDNLYQLSRYYQTSVTSILAQNTNIDPYNLPVGKSITIPVGEKITTQGISAFSIYPDSRNQMELMEKMRLAWSQHVYWTRMVLISIAQMLEDENDVTERLLRNPKDIAQIFGKYYSPETANAIEQLLTEHLAIGAKLITALRDANTDDANDLIKQWYKNADQMADAFSSINPYYKKEDVRKMLYSHLDLTTQEVAARLMKDYKEDIKMFDKVEEEAMMMADYFSDGIIKQFPQKFS